MQATTYTWVTNYQKQNTYVNVWIVYVECFFCDEYMAASAAVQSVLPT